jgi:hypothetical protein
LVAAVAGSKTDDRMEEFSLNFGPVFLSKSFHCQGYRPTKQYRIDNILIVAKSQDFNLSTFFDLL